MSNSSVVELNTLQLVRLGKQKGAYFNSWTLLQGSFQLLLLPFIQRIISLFLFESSKIAVSSCTNFLIQSRSLRGDYVESQWMAHQIMTYLLPQTGSCFRFFCDQFGLFVLPLKPLLSVFYLNTKIRLRCKQCPLILCFERSSHNNEQASMARHMLCSECNQVEGNESMANLSKIPKTRLELQVRAGLLGLLGR